MNDKASVNCIPRKMCESQSVEFFFRANTFGLALSEPGLLTDVNLKHYILLFVLNNALLI